MEITSLTNAKVKQWVKYKEKKYREQDQSFLIEGEHLIEEAHRAGIIRYLIIDQAIASPYPEYETYEVTPEILHKISSHVSQVQQMAVCAYPDTKCTNKTRILALDDVQDPGNVGTMIRTALSFGYDALLLSEKCADVYNEKVIRSTQGALFHMPFIRCDLKQVLVNYKQQGYYLYGTSLHDAKPLQEVSSVNPHILVMGNEGSGVHEELLALCDENIYIEMDTFESLNVAVAAGICMYQLRQR